MWNQTLGSVKMFLLKKCPLAFSIGEEVEENKRTMIWEHGKLPFLALDHTKCIVTCPEDNRWTASRVHKRVPYFKATVSSDPKQQLTPVAAQGADSSSFELQEDNENENDLAMNVDQVPVSRAGDEASCKDEVCLLYTSPSPRDS